MTLFVLYCIGGSVGFSEPRSGRTRRHTLSALFAGAASTERVRRCDLRIVVTDVRGVLWVGAANVCPKPEIPAVLWVLERQVSDVVVKNVSGVVRLQTCSDVHCGAGSRAMCLPLCLFNGFPLHPLLNKARQSFLQQCLFSLSCFFRCFFFLHIPFPFSRSSYYVMLAYTKHHSVTQRS